MRILFMGTAELACPCLEAVAGEVITVVTQPDRPKGRRLQLTPPPVKVTAAHFGLPVWQPVKVREAVEEIRAHQPELIVVVAYGQILPNSILDIPELGCVNVHTSLLPRWRGASPIQSAILAGDAETGVTTMFLDEKMDTGDIILQQTTRIEPTDTGASLHDRLAGMGAALLRQTVDQIAAGTAERQPQDHSQATYARKFAKEDGRIDWAKPAAEIDRQIRAFDPWPGAYTQVAGTLLKVWKAIPVNSPHAPGMLHGDIVGSGAGGLRLIEVQPAGGKRMKFMEFQRGHRLLDGALFR